MASMAALAMASKKTIAAFLRSGKDRVSFSASSRNLINNKTASSRPCSGIRVRVSVDNVCSRWPLHPRKPVILVLSRSYAKEASASSSVDFTGAESLVSGQKVMNTGSSVKLAVDQATFGRTLNVISELIDVRGKISSEKFLPFHHEVLAFTDQGTEQEILVTEIKTGQVQQTISRPVTRVGKGLHSGEQVTLTLFPATVGEGRYFVYVNKIVHEKISASADNVVETRLNTCLGSGHTKVQTVEHLMSALEGLGVHNCRIEVRGGQEVPLLDGSALKWVEAVEEVGLSMAKDRHGYQSSALSLKVHKPICVFDRDSYVAAFPAPTTRITCGIDFPQKAIGRQWFTWYPTDSASYKTEVAAARTFGIFEQIEYLYQAGLIKGGSLDNALVCSESGWLNPPLRFPDEPCRHKLLDLVGDLALCARSGHLGLPVAHIVAFKASHSLHVRFCKKILQAQKDQL